MDSMKYQKMLDDAFSKIKIPTTAEAMADVNVSARTAAAANMGSGALPTMGIIGAAVGASTGVYRSMTPKPNSMGSLQADAGCLGLQTPFILIQRKVDQNPGNDALGHLEGFPAYTKCKLSACKGFTVVDKVIVNVNCTDEERAEIERLLKEGVYL